MIPKRTNTPRPDQLALLYDGPHPQGVNGLPRFAAPAPYNSHLVVVGGRFDHVETVIEGGLLLGWDTCQDCARHVRVCQCPSGIRASAWLVRQSGVAPEAPTYVRTAPAAPTPTIRATTPQRPAQRAQRSAQPPSTRSPQAAQPTQPAEPTPTLGELHVAAATQADAALAKLQRKLKRTA
jgi:hypothetical protein